MRTRNTQLQPFKPVTEILKVLTHPARIAILELLRDGEHCVCHMEAYLGLRQAYISQQLTVLRECGLIQDRRDGWNVYYHVVDERIYEVLDTVQKMTGQEIPKVNRAGFHCTCPRCQAEQQIASE